MATRLGEMFGAGASDTFLGLRSCDAQAPDDGTKIVMLGVDTVTPYASVGPYCAGGAQAIRAGAADFAANVAHVNFDFGAPSFPDLDAVADAGTLDVDPADGPGNRAKVEAVVRGLVTRNIVPVLIGGDDSLPLPLIAGMAALERPVWVVQVDAHLDWRDEVQGECYGLSSPMRRSSEMDHVAGIVQIGLRGIGSARPSDRDDALAWGAHLVPMREVARNGVAAAIENVPQGADIVVVFDWDALDPAIMPAVIARTPGGLDYWTAFDVLDRVSQRGRVVGASFAEFMSSNDLDGQGARVAAQLLISWLGLIARR